MKKFILDVLCLNNENFSGLMNSSNGMDSPQASADCRRRSSELHSPCSSSSKQKERLTYFLK